MNLKPGVNRRHFLKSAAAIPLLQIGCSQLPITSAKRVAPVRRVRPGDPAWPSAESWNSLNQDVEGRLVKVQFPLALCQKAPISAACSEIFTALKNPYYIGDQPGLTQTSGWVDAWTSAPSVYAVAATKTEDVVAAVKFARENNLRLVVKGGGHSYQGTSNSADSLLIWTRGMKNIVLHDAFVARGCAGKQAPQPAVTVEAGAIWMHTYDAVTTKAGRYVQGGGCTTVGVAGLIQSGGFGSFSKNYGLAAAGLLEAEVVTADGAVRIANACTHPDLFWGIKGGGGGSLGVVTKVTLRTRELPDYFGGVFGTIRAKSDNAFRKLTARIISFYHDHLFNRHWGEQIVFERGNAIRIAMVFQGLDRQQAASVWRPFLDWVAGSPQDFSMEKPVMIVEVPARHFWDAEAIKKNLPGVIVSDDRPGAPESNFFWAGDGDQAGQVLHGYKSAWLPAILLKSDQQARLVDALLACSHYWNVSLHFNKGLAGAPAEELAAARNTATNPAVLDAFALAIIAGNGPPAFRGIPGREPDVAAARQHARAIGKAMDELMRVVTNAGSYVSESDFFEPSWQQSFWG
ncbi:MAG TPA: FAD-dependent oxidoreductase, partial [Candidatus Binatia bacterium]|nr:FAD-dependent oxidoreductase [Candidatus Binatia bacterium]